MTALFGPNAADRSATSWHEALAPWEALEFVISDAAKGIASGLDRLARQRQGADDPTPLAPGLDLFHTAREARTVLFGAWRRAEAAWTHAETCDTLVAQAKRGGLDARNVAQTARAAWRQAEVLLGCVERQESAWRRARAALDLFDAAGRLNTSQPARAETAATLSALTGSDWKRVRNFVSDPRSTAFLDRMHKQLAEVEPRVDWCEAMAWRWWCEQERPGAGGNEQGQLVQDRPESSAGGDRGHLVCPGCGGAEPYGACQLCGGVHEQRPANAAVPAQEDDSADAGSEAALLELPCVGCREAKRGLPVPAFGAESADVVVASHRCTHLRRRDFDAETPSQLQSTTWMRRSLSAESTACPIGHDCRTSGDLALASPAALNSSSSSTSPRPIVFAVQQS